MTRRSFSQEFKLEAVHLADTSGNSSQAARELGIKADMIRRWRKRIEEDGKRAIPGHGKPYDEDFARLQKEVRRLREENIVLKKAAGLARQFAN